MDRKERRFPKSFVGLLVIAAMLLSFNAGWALRMKQEQNGWLPADAQAPAVLSLMRTTEGHAFADDTRLVQNSRGSQSATTTARKTNVKPYETLDEVRRAINDNFVKEKVDETELTYGAVRGMLRSLGDRFTRFLTPEEYAEFQVKNEGEFVGIGARIDIKDDYSGGPQSAPLNASRPYIVEPMPGGPAQKAGIKRDDVILSIDGRSTADMSDNAVVSYIRGTRGTPVKLKIERTIPPAVKGGNRTFQVLDLTLTRDVIEVHPVTLTWLDDNIAWLRLDEFNKKSDAEMTKAIQEIRDGKGTNGPARGLVLDMRNNPGGLLDVAVDISSRFIPSGPVVYTRERNGEEHAMNAQNKRFANLKMPVVVLINKYSASAAEILAGALKDKSLATVVGEHSYGKASVQVLIELKNGGALVITTAKYLTPAKHDISDKGIIPDIVVTANAEDEATGRGAQLQKAVAFLKQKNPPTVAARPRN